MNKQEKKLVRYNNEADNCLTREEAQKILAKVAKTRAKLLVQRIIDDE